MDALFSEVDLAGTLNNQPRAVREKIEKLPEDYLLTASEEDLVSALTEEAKWEPPILGDPYVAGDREIDLRKTNRVWNETYTVKGSQITLRIPFTGDTAFFRMRPPHQQWNPPVASIENGYLEVTYTGENLTGSTVRAELDKLIADIKVNLDQLIAAAETHNNTIGNTIREYIQARKKRILERRSMVAGIGLPIQHRQDAPRTYSVPDIRRKARIAMPLVKEQGFVPEPALLEQEYEAILSIMRNMVSVMERSPNAFRHLEEEDLRWHFLFQLNGQYEGRATGETFNYNGKTDILIREKDRNVFVAECKVWKGKESLTAALDQILDRYLHWRDTKAAVLIFNRNKDFTNVLKQIVPTVEAHPCFKRSMGQSGDTEWKFVFGNRNDLNREILLTVMVFDVPSEA
jgi:hypothetical protein